MITSLHWYTWSNMPNICGTRRRKEKDYVNKTNFRCFRDGLSWIPDALKSIVLNPPGWAVHQRTAASHLRLFFNTYKNDRWIWSTCFSCCVTRAFFFLFFYSDAQTVRGIGRLVMRRVCVPELDQRFLEMAETFNKQQEGYEAMVQHIRNLQQSCDCSHDDTLAFVQCLGKIREEQGEWHILFNTRFMVADASLPPPFFKNSCTSRTNIPGLS